MGAPGSEFEDRGVLCSCHLPTFVSKVKIEVKPEMKPEVKTEMKNV